MDDVGSGLDVLVTLVATKKSSQATLVCFILTIVSQRSSDESFH